MGSYQAIVVGGGPAGGAAAALLAASGVHTALVARPDRGGDPRTVALMLPSLKMLEGLGLWPGDLKERSSPLKVLKLIDDTGGALAAPALSFAASELGEEAFGWNVPLAQLVPALRARAVELGVTVFEREAARLDGQRLSLAGGEVISAPVFVAADGRDSRLRDAAGIRSLRWSFDQAAIATSFAHAQDHRGVSTEYHGSAGPFTTVPMPGNRSSLVWMERPARAQALMALDAKAMAAEIQLRTHGRLGLIDDVGPRKLFAMGGLTAECFARNRVMLAGEAAHAGPPIGAQGLNMSLRDAAFAAEIIAQAISDGEDPGGAGAMAAYGAARRVDVAPRQFAIDLMNRSLISDFLPAQAARALALKLAGGIAPVRAAVMRQGLAPERLPLAMRG